MPPANQSAEWRAPKAGNRRTFGAEWVGYVEGYPLPSRLRDLGCVMSSPSGVRGRAPTGNAFWRILEAIGRFLCTYMPML